MPRSTVASWPGVELADSAPGATDAAASLRREAPRGATRFEKDVLAVGDWLVAGRNWRVTPYILRTLAREAVRARRAGARVPLVWNHSSDARDKLGEVDQFLVRGDALVARGWVAKGIAARALADRRHEVSVEVRRGWRDGSGRVYPLLITHVGVVLHPVISGQANFRNQLTNGGNPMSHDSREPSVLSLSTPDVLQRLSGLLRRLLQRAIGNVDLPDGLGLDDLIDRVETALRESGENDAPTVGDAPPTDPEGVRQLWLAYEATRGELDQERERTSLARQSAFCQQLDRLIGEGRLAPADRPGLLVSAAATGYQLSLLTPFERIPAGAAIPLRRVAARHATPEPPRVKEDGPMNAARAKDIARDYRR